MAVASSFGARVVTGGVRFSVPASRARECAVRIYEGGSGARSIPMSRSPDGTFETFVPELAAGARYRYVLDGEEVGDPFARFLPEGVDRPASVESLAHEWKHEPLGASSGDLVLYELHVGTFTAEGTYRAAIAHLAELAELGVGAIEVMPLAAFPGKRGWGYDGVAHYAPHPFYGTREDLAAFVDAAHALGLRVVLDVVYNHFGPSGNTLRRFAPETFTGPVPSPWGESLDFTSPILRAYVLDNVRYWLEELRFDGLRLDATHTLRGDRETHILKDTARVAHGLSPRRFVIAEDERNDPGLVRDMGLDGIWADDFHHEVHVALTRERDGYYRAYTGLAAELARTIQRGWLYCGEVYPPSGEPRGRPASGLEASAFFYCIQNHDQIGNRARGERLSALTDLDGFAAASFLLLLLPMSATLFMGQEWAATSPFLYFTDHDAELGRKVTEGRRKEFARFEAFGGGARVPDPQLESTWTASRLDWSERTREPHVQVLSMYRRLLRLRREDPVIRDRSRAHMHAWDQGDLLIVDRRNRHGARRIIANLTDAPRSLDDLARGLRLMDSSSGAPWPASSLPKHTAVLLGNEGEPIEEPAP